MGKYKLYKKEKNLVVKQMNIIYKEDEEKSIKHFCGFLTGSICFGIIHKCLEDDNLFLGLWGISLGAMLFEGYIGSRNAKKSDKAMMNLRNLEKKLKEKGINTELLSLKTRQFYQNHETVSDICILDNSDQLIYLDGKYSYFDADKNTKYMITDEVNECLLSKRQYKKYLKDRQKY